MASILVFGDSIMAGWNGKERVTETVPRQIGEILGATVTNLAVDGTRIHSGGQSLEQLVGTTDMSGYDLVMLGYGTNDWGYQDESLDDMRHGLDFFKQKLQGENPNAKVFYELPMEQFGLNSTSLDDKNNKGISQNDVINFLKQYASDNGWGYYDWRSDPLITYANRMEATGDNGWGHPTNTVMAEMAKRLAAAIKPYLSGSNDSDSIIDKMKHYKYLYFGFDPAGENANDLWRAIACLCGSNDAIHWDLIAHLPQLGNYVRDGNIAVYDDWYYLVGTTFMYRTKDFQTFEELDVSFLKRDGYKDIWAPEFFTDLNGNWHVIWCANNGSRHVYVADFDPEMGTTTNTWQQVDEDGGIDPHIWTHNGKYYLWIDGYWMYESDSYLGPFTEVKTNIQHPGIDWTNEGGKWKQMVLIGTRVRQLYKLATPSTSIWISLMARSRAFRILDTWWFSLAKLTILVAGRANSGSCPTSICGMDRFSIKWWSTTLNRSATLTRSRSRSWTIGRRSTLLPDQTTQSAWAGSIPSIGS